ncbi:MAG TPA: carotenoid biosynthesis protein [Candidatus Limnocylindria bacterium]
MDPVYLALEIGAATFFLGALAAAAQRGRLPALELVSAAAFGVLLEEGDQLIFQTYHYNAAWTLVLDRAPIVIGLTWALIIAGAMRLTDALGVRRRYAPVVDALLAISLDLSFDAIAIRMGLWTWREVGPTDGWFGVPFGNFYAWLFVTVGFSLVTRWLRDASRPRPSLEWLQLLVPLPAFALLLIGLIPFIAVKPLIDDAPGGGGIPFLVTLAAFIAVSGWAVFGTDRARPDGERMAILDLRLATLTRVAIHCYFLGALLVMGLATQLPVLLAVALLLLAAEVPLSRLVARRHQRHASRPASEPAVELGSAEPAA